MSISVPDKMDDYARDCVVRLANRVDDKVLRECDLLTALMIRCFASDFCKWRANGRWRPWMKEIGHPQ